MKKLYSLLLVVCFLFSLCACGGNKDSENNDTGSFCTACGEEISKKDNFCRYCGARVDSKTNADTSPDEEPNSEPSQDESAFENTNADLDEKYTYIPPGQWREFSETEKELLSHVVDYWCGNGYGQHLAVTDDGSVYLLSFDKKYSNGTYHMKIETDIKFAKVLDGYFISWDNNMYRYNCEMKEFQQVVDVDVLAGENRLNVFLSSAWQKEYYKVENNSIYSLADNKLLYSFPDGEVIERTCDGAIKTNMGYYQVGTVRIESEFADIEDTFEFQVTPLSFAFDFTYVNCAQNAPHIIIVGNRIFEAYLA